MAVVQFLNKNQERYKCISTIMKKGLWCMKFRLPE
jgi:hypothetical protein